jgi:methyl-accepting chemotaxis protein
MGSKNTTNATLIRIIIFFSLSYFAFGVHSAEQESDNLYDNSGSVVALTMQNIAGNIDKRISSMKMLANTIANDTHIQQWVDTGFSPADENTLISKLGYLVSEYELTSASFADTKSNKYWNHEGFLRVLVPEIDTWYFAFLESGEQNLISVYHDKNKKRVDLYVNYRQPNGNGLSGIATSFNGVIETLAKSPLNKYGELFIVDNAGKVQVHPDPKIAGKFTLEQLYSAQTAQTLLAPQSFNYADNVAVKDQYLVSSYIPSMDWFIVAQLKDELH